MDRQIQKLYIEATSACNLNCSMCFRHGWIDEQVGMMSNQIVDRVLQIPMQLPSLRTVMFSGMGEPLTHPRICEMIRSFSDASIRTELLTNGTLLTKTKAETLVNSGLDMLWVSVDGFDRAGYEQVHIGSRFDLIIDNLTNFQEVRGDCQLGITFVIMKDNISELEKINDFADRFNVDLINLSYAVPGEPLHPDDSLYYGPYQIGKQKRVSAHGNCALPGDYCPFVAENGCFIKWNGDVVPCMQLLHSSFTYLFEEKRKVYSKNFGNISVASLRQIWEGKSYTEFRNRVLDFEFSDCTYCMGCEDRLENVTDCRYNPFPTCGACLWAQGIARCP